MDVIRATIKDKGYIHLPSFLNAEVVRELQESYEGIIYSDNKNYKLKQILDLSVFPDDVLKCISDLREKCFPGSDHFLHGAFFFTVNAANEQESINFPFHQDHESFYIFQNHEDYLNFYIVLKKQDADNSNLTVVPFDRLKDKNSDFYQIVKGAGCTRFENEVLTDESNGSSFHYGFPLEEISETPKLNEGDLLLLRGDLIHRTQNIDSDRVAISFRSMRSDSLVNYRTFTSASLDKLKVMNRNFVVYAAIDYIFKSKKKDYLTAKELFVELLDLKNRYGDKRPLSLILRMLIFKFKLWLRIALHPLKKFLY